MEETKNSNTHHYTIDNKPLTDMFSIESKKSLIESYQYSESEFAGKAEELSFQVSLAFKERFPRFSGASISVADTPVKDQQTPFREYSEFIDSPKLNLLSTPIKISNATPIDSPKQVAFSINEVKEILSESSKVFNFTTPVSNKHNIIDSTSPYNRQAYPSKRGKRLFDGEHECVKSLQTEPTGTSEQFKAKFCEETQKPNCQCSSCVVI